MMALSLLIAAQLAAGQAPAVTTVAITGATPRWVQHFGSEHTDWTNRAIELPGGRIVAAGFLNRDDEAESPDWNAFVESFDGEGRRVSSQSYGGPGVDAAWALQPRADGSWVIGGISAERAGGDFDASLTITAERPLDPVNKSFGGPKDDRATDVLVLSDGDLLLVGQTDSSGAGGIDVFLVKTDPAGNELWRRTHGSATDDRGFLGLPTRDGGAIVAGVTGPRGSYDLLLMRIAPDGSEVWKRVIAGSANDATHGLARLKDGRILLTGYGPSWGGRENDVSVLLFDDDGKLFGHQLIGGPGDDRVQFAAADERGGAWLTGYTKSFASDWRMLVAKVGPDGAIEPWLGAIGGSGDMNGSTIATTRNGDLLLGGYSELPSGGKSPPDAFVMRLDPDQIDKRRDEVTVRTLPTKCAEVSATEQRCS